MISVGSETALETRVTQELINTFASITGDNNPIHVNADSPLVAALKKKLGITVAIAHGTLVFSLISRPLWQLGGPGTVLGSVGELRFLKPTRIGDTITVRCVAQEALSETRYAIEATFKNQHGEDVIAPTRVIIFVFN